MAAPLSITIRWARRAALVTTIGAAVYAAFALVGALAIGIPDNGDFRKYNRHFVDGPAGEASARPATYDAWREAYRQRGWHRFWRLRPADQPGPPPVVGAGPTPWLWGPGVALHRTLRSGPVLDATWIGLLPRTLLLLTATLLAALAGRDAVERRAPSLLLAAPAWPLLLTTGAMSAYLNTFYREAGTLTFAALFVAALAGVPRLPPLGAASAVFVTGALLVASAPAHGPFALVVAVAGIDVGCRGSRGHGWRQAAVVAAAGATLALGAWRMQAVEPDLRGANAYNAIFLGLLPLSDAPESHLASMRLPPESIQRIGEAAFNPRSRAWRREHGAELDHLQVVRLIVREPALLPRAALAATGILNRTSMRQRRLQAEDAPRSGPRPFAWNLWGEWQRRWFPRGGGFLLWCVIAIPGGLAVRRLGDEGLTDIGRLVATTTAGALLEVGFKYAADGPTEPSRHLVAANLLLGASVAGALWLLLALRAAWSRDRGAPRTDRPPRAPRAAGQFLAKWIRPDRGGA